MFLLLKFKPFKQTRGNVVVTSLLQTAPTRHGVYFDHERLIVGVVHQIDAGKQAACDLCSLASQSKFTVGWNVGDAGALLLNVGAEIAGFRDTFHRSDKLVIEQQDSNIKTWPGDKRLQVQHGPETFECTKRPQREFRI